MNTVYLIDFDDSFVFNIFSELTLRGIPSKIIHYTKLPDKAQLQLENASVILGPGPGSPSEYANLKGWLTSILNNNMIRIIGICLGHQILCECLGADIIKSNTIIHGETIHYKLDDTWKNILKSKKLSISVQRYNSLAATFSADSVQKLSVDWNLYFDKNECIMLENHQCFSCQFHPESIGTEKNEIFFDLIKEKVLAK